MFSIAIDGPAGAGKSSIARAVSKKLGIIYLDTGALYRALGYYFLEKKISIEDSLQIENVINDCYIKLLYHNAKGQQIFINGKRVDRFIRSNEVSMAASIISKNFVVRQYLLKIQKDFAKKSSVVMDGRDIGTVILPDANLKIFLTASLEVRAKRRFEQFLRNGYNIEFEEVLNDIKKRDLNDSKRKISPLKIADDAVVIDTSKLSLKESVEKVISLVKKIDLEEHC